MDHLLTEARNPASANLDKLTPLEIVRLMNAEDAKIAPAIAEHAEAIARAIDVIAARLAQGGRLIYVGAGTSGRLGVLDATECPPTFNSPPGQVMGLIAGGPRALTQAVEGAEDHPEFAATDLQGINLNKNDVVVGIATSGRTPYVLGAVEYAKSLGVFTIGLSCNVNSDLGAAVDLPLTIPVGAEVLSGSTRLKAGTATKLVLNMLTTGAMIRLGKTFGNLMVDLRATNEKLRARTNRIVRHLTGLEQEAAARLLDRSGGELKTALVAQLANVEPDVARQRLSVACGKISDVVGPIDVKSGDDSTARDLCIGIDGGGTKTIALLARVQVGDYQIIGRGEGGPSNLQTAGPRAFAALDDAVSAAFIAAGLQRQRVASACMGLAGADRPGDRARLLEWATSARLAESVDVTNDAAILLAAGTPEGWGVAVVAGTGSIAFARNHEGKQFRAGGWGPLLGDEGSAYKIAVAGLQEVSYAADGRGNETAMTAGFLAAFNVATPQELIPKVYALDRPGLAKYSSVVFDAAAKGDTVANAIVETESILLASTAQIASRRAFGGDVAVPMALAGGVFTGQAIFRERFLYALKVICKIETGPLAVVEEPAQGAIKLAARTLSNHRGNA